ncbi:serine hydrolase domain-containing protein [Amycolatopsis sp. NPDC059657]|uniref:serine hydrolase domain-containing protein n=1 Tax=Amycolatopsis sp. NPDC059657 TaxID=3346899 RepID=UPI00366F2651
MALVLSATVAQASPSGLQRDLDAVRDSGAVGVQARVVSPGRQSTGGSGTAVLGRNVPVSVDGHFRIGSDTKTFVATVLLQLTAQRRVSLDDKVAKWLPDLVRGNGNDGNRITVRDLLQHTSGIYDYPHEIELEMGTEAGFRKNRFLRMSPEKVVELSVAHPPVFEPGTKWEYSNVNYVIAGMIIEKVTGHSWRDEVRQRVIRPLGLWDTTLPGDSPFLPRPHAEGYTLTGTGSFRSTEVSLGWAGPAAEIVSTTKDLGTFWRALLGGRLLPPAQLAEMKTTVPIGVPGAGYGLGVLKQTASCGTVTWFHAGGTPGFVTNGAVTEDGRTSVVMSMSDDGVTPGQGTASARLVDNAICQARQS